MLLNDRYKYTKQPFDTNSNNLNYFPFAKQPIILSDATKMK